MSEWNTGIVEEFRTNDGQVGGMFAEMPLLLLHHKGARSGTDRVNPLAYQKVDSGYAVFASKGGADNNPDWYHNVIANPETRIEVGTEVFSVKAREVNDDEYQRIWEQQKRDFPQFARYEEKTAREQIPVIVLDLA